VDALAWGFGLVEAPCAADDGSVYFSDALGGGVHRWSPDREVETVVPKRRGIGGMCFHADGGVVVSGRDLVHVRDGETRRLFGRDDVTGFNDLATGSDGRVYVGALHFMPFGGEEPVPGEVWRVDAPGDATQVLGEILWANGIGFSPDGGTLYASDFATGDVIACELESRQRHVLARTPSGDADGLAVDVEGAVWVACGSGGMIARYSAAGELEDTLDVPAGFVTSLCFGGMDGRDLYVTTMDNADDPSRRGTLFRTRAERAGLPVAAARI
jgi:sugar lactone lactonase YvrE